MELFVETHVRNEDRQKGVEQFIDSQDQLFVVRFFQKFSFLSYYFLKFDDFIFNFWETYNS
jgi:hypothetical protein